MSEKSNETVTPEVTGEVKETAKAKKEAEKRETTTAKETAKGTKKVYKFQSTNKFLTCTALGVQFMEGKAETANLDVAKALAKIDGVALIEE